MIDFEPSTAVAELRDRSMHMVSVIATPEQRERYLAPLAAGDARSCFAMTEPVRGAGRRRGASPQTVVSIAMTRRVGIHPGRGMADTRRWVYACDGRSRTSDVGPRSTTVPACITRHWSLI